MDRQTYSRNILPDRQVYHRLSVEFKKLGFGTHEKFDEIAAKIRKKQEIHSLLKEMDELTRNCDACYVSYKIELESEKK